MALNMMNYICGIDSCGSWGFAPKGLVGRLLRRALPYANALRALPCRLYKSKTVVNIATSTILQNQTAESRISNGSEQLPKCQTVDFIETSTSAQNQTAVSRISNGIEQLPKYQNADFIENSMIAQYQSAVSRISNSVGQRPTRKATLPFVRPEGARAKEETKQLKTIYLC
jgi:hypothetical protein